MMCHCKGFYRFPAIRTDNSVEQQIGKIHDELQEVKQALDKADVEHAAEELVDVIHAAETALRILQGKHWIDVDAIADTVTGKNQVRGYYR